MARLPRVFRFELSVTDCVTIRSVRYTCVETTDQHHVLREEKSGKQVLIAHPEFADLLAIGDAAIDYDAFILWEDIGLLPPADDWGSLNRF